jgi:glycosyltransferase involved in cell wall biosynthesis
MREQGRPSLALTRDPSNLNGVVTIKPITRIAGSLRARWRTVLGKFGFIDNSYALFGIEKCPVSTKDIHLAIGSETPTAFIFYWISYFVSFESILKLRQAYPSLPFIFVCLDDSFLTGGCHFSNGCLGYRETCNNCPATSSTRMKMKIEQGFRRRQALVSAINPTVIYPTTYIQQTGKKSAILKNTRSLLIPLGAVSNRELNIATDFSYRRRSGSNDKKEMVTLLVRSSSEYRKGCDLFVAALKTMSERIPSLSERLKIISVGDEMLTIARIDKYVSHVAMGYVQRKELMSIYLNVDAFVVTSREDGGPLMINECVALGIFVISTPVGVAGDLIVEKENGLITRDVSSNAISEALIEFMDYCKVDHPEMEHTFESQMRGSSLTFESFICAIMETINDDSG